MQWQIWLWSWFDIIGDVWDIGKVIWGDISEILLSLSVLRVGVWLTRGRWWGRLLIRWPQGQGQRHGASSIKRWCHNYTPNRVLQMDWGIFRESHVSKSHQTRSSSICRLPTKACCQLTEQHSVSCLFDVKPLTVAPSFYRLAGWNVSNIGFFNAAIF